MFGGIDTLSDRAANALWADFAQHDSSGSACVWRLLLTKQEVRGEKGYSDILGFLAVMAEMLDNQGKQL